VIATCQNTAGKYKTDLSSIKTAGQVNKGCADKTSIVVLGGVLGATSLSNTKISISAF
jgi:hypothetical protein